MLRVSSTNSDCLKGQQILNVIRSIGPQTALQPFSTDVFSFARLNEQDYIALIPQLLKQSCLAPSTMLPAARFIRSVFSLLTGQ